MRLFTEEECEMFEDIYDERRVTLDPQVRFAAMLAAATANQLMREKIAVVLSGKSTNH